MADRRDAHAAVADSAGGSRRDDVLAAAGRLFDARGYAGTTMTDIATEVGLLPGSLYHYFPAKEDLAVALLRDYHDALEDAVSAASRGVDAETDLRGLVRCVMEVGFGHRAAMRLLSFDAPRPTAERFGRALRADGDLVDSAWQRTTQALGSNGRLRPGIDVDTFAFAMRRIAETAPGMYPGGPPTDQLPDHCCDVVLSGLITTRVDLDELDRGPARSVAEEVVSSWQPARSGEAGIDGVVAAATREFARRGFEATTVRDIAAAAGVSMASLYRRVDSKDSLLALILDDHARRIDAGFTAVASASRGVADLLNALARILTYASLHFRDETKLLVLGGDEGVERVASRRGYFEDARRRVDTLRDALARGIRDGEVRAICDADELVLHVRGALWLQFGVRPQTTQEQAFAFVRTALLRGALT